MLSIFHGTILGIIQGLAEFLPISSSAHLVLIPYIFNWHYQGLDFDVALHMGTAIAVIVFFWSDWLSILVRAFSKGKNAVGEYPKNLLWQIIIASIPAAIAGYLLDKHIEALFHSPLLLAINLMVFGIILWVVDRFAGNHFEAKNIGYKQSLIVGVAQCLALIPGVSRSGITLVASRGLGLKREAAARFSFLLGTPATIGAFLFEFRKISAESFTLPFIVSVLVSMIVGLLAIRFLLDYLKKSDFSLFVWYRFVLAAIVILLVIIR